MFSMKMDQWLRLLRLQTCLGCCLRSGLLHLPGSHYYGCHRLFKLSSKIVKNIIINNYDNNNDSNDNIAITVIRVCVGVPLAELLLYLLWCHLLFDFFWVVKTLLICFSVFFFPLDHQITTSRWWVAAKTILFKYVSTTCLRCRQDNMPIIFQWDTSFRPVLASSTVGKTCQPLQFVCSRVICIAYI